MEVIYNADPIDAAAAHLARNIKVHLDAGERVLWVLSGGSGSNVIIAAARMLATTDLTNLSATLSDERYGNVGHANENWQQLLNGGLPLPGATLYRPLINKDRATTTREFSTWIDREIHAADYSIGLFGIGTDGHTAGIKPHSNAIETKAWATDYMGDDFERITITTHTIIQLDEAIIQASGNDKASILKQLLRHDIAVIEQPAQILKSIAKCTLYTDNKEL